MKEKNKKKDVRFAYAHIDISHEHHILHLKRSIWKGVENKIEMRFAIVLFASIFFFIVSSELEACIERVNDMNEEVGIRGAEIKARRKIATIFVNLPIFTMELGEKQINGHRNKKISS